MAYEIVVHELAASEIAAIRAFDQRRIVNTIEEQLTHQPTVPTRRRKLLTGVTPAFEHAMPVWELRVGDYRVFYDVDESSALVNIRAVRRKPPELSTGDIV